MSLDTAQRRCAVLGLGDLGPPPWPDGAAASVDRAQSSGQYYASGSLIFMPPASAGSSPRRSPFADPANDVARFRPPVQVSRNLWITTAGAVATAQPAEADIATTLFGGHYNVVTEAEAAILTAAGYSVGG